MTNTDGSIRYGWIPGDKTTPELRERIRLIREEIESSFQGRKDYGP